ncbi:MAG: Phosphate starvation-inducible protein PhoH, predicted ATPase [Ignavibacteriae bacterium]|nr:MAG: Phosphate starvation-inducible protein PhoH, predicted ATPase [Ignavibacteriota bacterium]
MADKKIKTDGVDMLRLLGLNDANLQIIENRFDADIIVRGDTIILRGETHQIEQLEKIFKELIYILSKNGTLTTNDVETVIDLVMVNGEAALPKSITQQYSESELDNAVLFTRNGIIKARTPGQREYIKQIRKNDIVFAIGPAGTGKTYLAVAMAVAALKNREIMKIVLARPAVEAGESLGFLPGDMKEKVDPYLRPLYDALDDMIPPEKLKNYIEKRVIEVVPLAYMRGRTLNNSFVILDEAQNATSMQMKMFLTRLGMNSKAIITGDITQIDLPAKTVSGLVQIQEILKQIEGVAFCYFDRNDVVRHKLVKDIIDAYDKYTANGKSGTSNEQSTNGN